MYLFNKLSVAQLCLHHLSCETGSELIYEAMFSISVSEFPLKGSTTHCQNWLVTCDSSAVINVCDFVVSSTYVKPHKVPVQFLLFIYVLIISVFTSPAGNLWANPGRETAHRGSKSSEKGLCRIQQVCFYCLYGVNLISTLLTGVLWTNVEIRHHDRKRPGTDIRNPWFINTPSWR